MQSLLNSFYSCLQITVLSLPTPGFSTFDVAVDNFDFEDCQSGQIVNNTGKEELTKFADVNSLIASG